MPKIPTTPYPNWTPVDNFVFWAFWWFIVLGVVVGYPLMVVFG